MAITGADAVAAAITTVGPGAGAIINGVIIAAGKPSLPFALAIPLPRRARIAATRTGRADDGAAGSAVND